MAHGISERIQGLLTRASVTLACVTVAATSLAATTFPGTGPGPIPDGPSSTPTAPTTPLTISFAVSGVTAPLTDIRVSMTLTHTFVGDVEARLISPGGLVSFPLFGRVGVTTATAFGKSNDLNGTYEFVDPAVTLENLWSVAAALTSSADPIPAGTYATTPVGGAGVTDPPALTNLVAAFAALPTAQVNGTWQLRIGDWTSFDTGTVTAASLTLESAPPPVRLATAPSTLRFGANPAVGFGPALPVLLSAPTANGATAVNVNTAANCSITGANAAQFAVVSDAVTVVGGQTRQLLVQFRPVGSGVRTASLNCPLTSTPVTTVSPATVQVALVGYAGEEPKPNCYDLDGNGTAAATVDGLLIVRQMLGITGAAIGQGITLSAPRNSPKKALAFARTQCGLRD